MKRKHAVAVAAVLFFLSACASGTKVNMAEPRRVVGTESAVRVDAQITDELRPGSPVGITYQITNQRGAAIAVADIVPETSYDRESGTVTVSIGSEVPGQVSMPRLIRIAPGETKSFTTTASIVRAMPLTTADPRAVPRALLRLKVNFLGDTAPFTELLDIPEKMVVDQKRADELFDVWLERNEVVYTNAVPVKITQTRPFGTEPAIERPTGRRRRG
ncbi:MAG TPA: hypothetical protein VNI54_18610 [Thermoanaerobaculia bacterium]|nr:hypothetical protein [Thermoanaerobaculia bacterium]